MCLFLFLHVIVFVSCFLLYFNAKKVPASRSIVVYLVAPMTIDTLVALILGYVQQHSLLDKYLKA